MTWTDRMKKTIETFKRMALPLFGFFILLALVEFIITVISLSATFLPFFDMNGFNPSFSPAPYMNPNIPVPPGYEYDPSLGYSFGWEELAPFMSMLPGLLGGIAILMVLSILIGSVFFTGIFHLTKKAYTEKAQFRDIKLKGLPRVLGWYAIVTLISSIVIGVGILLAMRFESPYSLAMFGLIYILVLMAVGLFVAPWVSSAPYYMLNHDSFAFGQAFKESWHFYRRHMGPLWGAFFTLLAIQLLVNAIYRSSPDIGLILSLLTTPFLTVLPIVWVLTLEEEPPLPIGNIYAPSSEQERHDTKADTPAEPSSPADSSHVPRKAASESVSRDPYGSSSATPLYTLPESPYSTPEPPYHSPSAPSYGGTSSGEQETEPVNFCPTCGKKVREGASYCSQCGTKL
ncbi:zinc-ribbon domain-containing protein [Desulfitobacterium chlororespirans DSM 11544]|uniref:Zinc-ribbon domain-containing protein n=1 Tax=Desulfitobacterium chlororespirans DSM 11544 TaxID=1121395 RepID=A0A1M7RTC1_9FIRM|nr:zinc-ribbon domain-containing protein [Desulfitobacterium chlororespirans]SHN49471.1 zinc-ribbon domain-containing protein [Desulfitobacterium chlororespirans DSM 11544]